MLPVFLDADADEVFRFHIGKFPEAVSLASWDGMKVSHVVNARADPPVAAAAPADLKAPEREKRDKALAEVAKNEVLLQELSETGEHVFCGKPLASAGNFAVLAKTSKGYTLSVVREWFEFSKKNKFKPLSIDEAEAHLQELQRKSVDQAAGINRRLAS